MEVLRAPKLCDELQVVIRMELRSKKQNEGCCYQNKTARQKENGRAELCGTALFGHESCRIDRQEVLLMGFSQDEE